MADLSTHYKEVSPEQTVQNIKKFFNDRKFTIKLTESRESEGGTWFCHVDLYLNNERLSGANGKGMTEAYSLASGYAELYERFCNGMTFLANPWWNRAVIDANKEKHGYYLRADEKLLTYDELTNNCYRTTHYLSSSCGADLTFQKAAVDYITNGQYIGLPMYNFADENDVMYMDPRLLLRMTHSIGMAAGNSLDEALNQGISELMEKYAQNELFKDWESTHYALDLKKIENPKLQDSIQKIEALGYKLYLVDLSYNYNAPVMMSILFDKKYHTININIGSFPVFDIAAERVLTELYQGKVTYRNENHLLTLQQPYKTYQGNLLVLYGNSISGEVLPETFLDRIEYKDTYNHEVFIDKNVSNEEIRKYYIDLSSKLNMKFYYLNNSLCDDMYAIHILCEGERAYAADELYDNSWNKTSIRLAKKLLKSLTKFYDGMYTNNVDYINLLELISSLSDPQDILVHNFIGEIRLWNDFLISENNGLQYNNLIPFISSDNLGVIYNSLNTDVLRDVMCTFLYNPFKCYLLLKSYVMSRAYDTEEVLNVFNNFLKYNIGEEDIYKCGNSTYTLKKAYIEPMYNYLHSEDYSKIINAFIK